MSETIANFLKRMGVIFKATPIDARPDRAYDALTEREREWERDAFHFLVSFKASNGETFATFYSMGKGNGRKGPDGRMGAPSPKGPEVLDALLSDAESWDNARAPGDPAPDVDTFAREMGYDDESPEWDHREGKRDRPGLMARARRAQRAFDACECTYRALVRLFERDGFDSLRACERE